MNSFLILVNGRLGGKRENVQNDLAERFPTLLGRRLLRAEAGVGAHDQFGKARFCFRLATQEGADNRAKEA
jgi:hypothetical protein